ncbi:MAG: hypothetical protein V3W44_05195 [Dehalococcoidales bacterium]
MTGTLSRMSPMMSTTQPDRRTPVIEVSPELRSVASGLSRSSACFACLHLPALVKQHRDASGVDGSALPIDLCC